MARVLQVVLMLVMLAMLAVPFMVPATGSADRDEYRAKVAH